MTEHQNCDRGLMGVRVDGLGWPVTTGSLDRFNRIIESRWMQHCGRAIAFSACNWRSGAKVHRPSID